MPETYSVSTGSFALAGAGDTAVEILASSELPLKIRRVEFSSDDTGGTTVVDVLIQRATATGTGTSITPAPFHQKAGASTFTAKFDMTVEGTYGTDLYTIKWNIQVPYTLVFGPDEEILIPGATNEGIGILFVDDPGTSICVTVLVEE